MVVSNPKVYINETLDMLIKLNNKIEDLEALSESYASDLKNWITSLNDLYMDIGSDLNKNKAILKQSRDIL